MKQVAVVQDEPIYEYTIENEVLKVNACNFGGTISGIYWKEDGTNLVASYKDPQDYVTQGGPYLNALVGPVAGRIAYGRYPLDGDHQLSINNGAHHLHGGATGISKQLFQVTQISDTKLQLHLETSHEADGYPAGIYVYDITYELVDDQLIIHYLATPPATSLINMTNHLYFNLNGMKSDITQHMLSLPSTKKCRIEQECHPSMIEPIQPGSAFDFTTLTSIHDNLKKGHPEFAYTKHYDTPFLLDEPTFTLYDPVSKHRLRITTDQTSVVVYSANYFDDALTFENGSKGYPLCCVALETQDIPNGINIEGAALHCIATPTKPYTQTTSYRFTKGDIHGDH